MGINSYAISYLLLVVLFGALVVFFIMVFDKQKKELLKKDEELARANESFKEINIGLERASEAKSTFLANMSHEIRTPVNAILGMNEMILRECDDNVILSYANDVDTAGHQLLAIINDILDFSKIESGKMEIHPVEYELFSIMNDCYNMIIMRARQKGIKIYVENDPNLPAILYGDEVRVRQIIMNILTNAVKYTNDGYVRITYNYEKIDAENIDFIIKVKDTGAGISEENKKHLFEAFERLDEINNRHIEGTGLGLSITKKFLDLMNGRISLESKENEGSTFTITIPQRIANHSEVLGDFAAKYKHAEYLVEGESIESIKMRTIASANSKVTIGNKEVTGASQLEKPARKKAEASFIAPDARVLVVDDVKMNLNVVRLLLKKTDVQMDLAESGAECLKYTMMKRYDLILMDHMMPEMDGIETLHNIKKQSMGLNQTTPVIALTANAVNSVEDMYLKEGFVAYLSKPVKGEKLEEALIKYLPEEKVTLNMVSAPNKESIMDVDKEDKEDSRKHTVQPVEKKEGEMSLLDYAKSMEEANNNPQ